MNILCSSALLTIALLVLADSIYSLRPYRKQKQKRKAGRIKKEQPMLRAKSSGVDLRISDLRKGVQTDA